MCDVSGETFKGFEVLQFFMSATTTQLLSSALESSCVVVALQRRVLQTGL
jgi:hypothetical protein